MKTSLYLLLCALLLDGSEAQCSLCPGGSSSLGNPNAALLPGSNDATCGDKEDIASASSDANCASVVKTINAGIDYSAFCCGDVQPTSYACKFCDGFSCDVNQPFSSGLFSSFITTCGQAKTLAQYISAIDAACTFIRSDGSHCCSQPTMPFTPFPSPSPTPSPTSLPTCIEAQMLTQGVSGNDNAACFTVLHVGREIECCKTATIPSLTRQPTTAPIPEPTTAPTHLPTSSFYCGEEKIAATQYLSANDDAICYSIVTFGDDNHYCCQLVTNARTMAPSLPRLPTTFQPTAAPTSESTPGPTHPSASFPTCTEATAEMQEYTSVNMNAVFVNFAIGGQSYDCQVATNPSLTGSPTRSPIPGPTSGPTHRYTPFPTCGEAKTETQNLSTKNGACSSIITIGNESYCCQVVTNSPTLAPSLTRPPTTFPPTAAPTSKSTPVPTHPSACREGKTETKDTSANDAACFNIKDIGSETSCCRVGITPSLTKPPPTFPTSEPTPGPSLLSTPFPTCSGEAATRYVSVDDAGCSSIITIGNDKFCCQVVTNPPTMAPSLTRQRSTIPTPEPNPFPTRRPISPPSPVTITEEESSATQMSMATLAIWGVSTFLMQAYLC